MEYATRVEMMACYGRYLHEFHMETHIHPDRYELMYVSDGNCEIMIENRIYQVRHGQFVYISPGIPHRLTVEKGCPCTVFNLEYAFRVGRGLELGEIYQKSTLCAQFWEEAPKYCVLEDSGKACFAIRDLVDELKKQNQDEYLLSLLFCRLYVEVAKCYEIGKKVHGGAGYINRAQEFISSYYASDISAGDVARYVGLNVTYLQRLFSETTGCGIMTFVRNMRLDKACFLLKNSNRSITDIAFACGYNSRQQFGYSFVHRYGMSPSEFRRLNTQSISIPEGKTSAC